MEALSALLLAASLAHAAPKDLVALRIHAFRASVWVTIDDAGRLKLKEKLPEDVARKPRKVTKKIGRTAAAKLVRDAEHAGFFELDERYAESSEATTSWRLEVVGPTATKAVTSYGSPPPIFQSIVDRIEELYGKPLLPGLARGAVRPAAPPPATRGPSDLPKDDRSREWED